MSAWALLVRTDGWIDEGSGDRGTDEGKSHVKNSVREPKKGSLFVEEACKSE